MLFRVPLVVMLFATGFQCASMSAACAVEPKIESLRPGVIPVGVTQTFTIAGEGLASLYDIAFYAPGIRCEEIVSKSDFEAVVKVSVTLDSPASTVPFRLLTHDGFSSLRTVRTVDLPVLIEPQRDRRASPVVVTDNRGVAIYGTLEQGAYDRYVCFSKKGASMHGHCGSGAAGRAFAGYRSESLFAIGRTDPSGRRLESLSPRPGTFLWRQRSG
jgi:hypothetical protein